MTSELIIALMISGGLSTAVGAISQAVRAHMRRGRVTISSSTGEQIALSSDIRNTDDIERLLLREMQKPDGPQQTKSDGSSKP